MNLRTRTIPGIEIAGSAVAFPCDVAPDTDTNTEAGTAADVDEPRANLGNRAAWRALLGEDWATLLAARGWDAEHPETAWGVAQRSWWRTPGVEETGTDAARDTGTEALARMAGSRALQRAETSAGELDLVLAATSTPGRITSSLAGRLGRAFGTDAVCVDVRAGGAGGLSAWITAALHLAQGAHSVLVVAAETPSTYGSPDEPGMSMLYGDGAGALVLKRGSRTAGGLIAAQGGSAGSEGRAFTVPAPLPPRAGGRYVFERPNARYLEDLAGVWDEACRTLRDFAGEPPEHFVPNAVTRGQLERAERVVGASAEAARRTLNEHGALGCAGPLVGLHELASGSGPLRGQRIGLCAVAGGIAWQAMLWET